MKETEASASRARSTLWGWIFLLATFVGLLNFSIEITDELSLGEEVHLLGPFINEMTGTYCTLPLLPGLLWLFRRYPLGKGTVLQRLPLYLASIVVFGTLHTTLMTVSRTLLYPTFGVGRYDSGILLYRYLMEFQKQFLIFWFVFAIVEFFKRHDESRRRRLRTAELEEKLAQARLQALKMRLNPHFLFNTLNLISSFMYENVDAADRMVSNLSDLLRAALKTADTQEVSLREELELLKLFLEITRARFGERLQVDFELENGVQDARFPNLVLQPLVENSIKHGLNEPQTEVRIQIRARKLADDLVVSVEDNGPGISSAAPKTEAGGVGLSATRERLEKLYGEAHEFTMENLSGRGLRVMIRIPYSLTADNEPRRQD